MRLGLLLVLLAGVLAQEDSAAKGPEYEALLKEIFGSTGDQQQQNNGMKAGEAAATSAPGNGGIDSAATGENGIDNNNADGQGEASYAPCILETGGSGVCVPYYLCDGNNSVIDDGKGIIDIRLNDGPCKNYMESCCGSDDVTNNSGGVTTELPPAVKERKGCGWRNPTGVGFTITGARDGEAQFGEFPWMVAILELKAVDESKKDLKVNVYIGGGSLIHRSVVLTAAHYVASKPGETFKVRAGEWDTQTKNEPYEYQNRAVKDIVVHKDFNKNNLFYDIALLFLETPMDLAPNVGVACLPPARSEALAGTRCFASGWGKDKFGKEGRYQVIMKKLEVPVVDHSTCQKKLRETRLGRLFQLHRTFMCAGGESGVDTCRGDGGSPLVCPIEYETERYMQYGIVAWGIGCGELGSPGVYVDVAVLRNWVDEEVIRKGFDVESYTYV